MAWKAIRHGIREKIQSALMETVRIIAQQWQ
jgi:hypothetical protein